MGKSRSRRGRSGKRKRVSFWATKSVSKRVRVTFYAHPKRKSRRRGGGRR